ncbi:Protein BPS1, chloroplastic [Glycine soja]
MKTISGHCVPVKDISVSKAVKILTKFVSADNGTSHVINAYLHRAFASFNELKQLHKELGSSHSHKKHKRHKTENGNDGGKFKRQQSGSGNADGENFSQQLDGSIGYESENVDGGEMHKKKKKKKKEVESLHDIDSTVKFGVSEADGKHVSSRNPSIEKCSSMVLTAAFSGSSKKLSDLNVADIHSWALDFRRLQNLVNEEIRAGVDTVEIEWLLKTFEELRAGAEKLSQVNDLLAKVVDGFFEAVMTSRDTLLSSVRFDKTVNDRSPGRNRDMQLVH